MLLQICPHDTPPFAELCRVFAQAAAEADLESTTIFLSNPSGSAEPGTIYLGVERLKQTRKLGKELANVVGQTKPAIILCHRYRAFRAALAAGLPQTRMVVLAHEFGLLDGVQRRLHRSLFARPVRFAGVSPAVAEELAQVARINMVLPNALDLSTLTQTRLSREAARERLGVADATGPLVGVVGRWHYKKRPELSLAVLELLRREHPDARMVMVGPDPGQATAEGLHVAGQVPRAADVMAAFDVLLHVGNVESFGMVLLEAMAAGVPVVAAKTPGPEFVLGDIGYFPAVDDASGYVAAISQALNASPERLSQGQGRAAEKFSIAATSAKLKSLAKFLNKPEDDPF